MKLNGGYLFTIATDKVPRSTIVNSFFVAELSNGLLRSRTAAGALCSCIRFC
jgi:hypothetical protein